MRVYIAILLLLLFSALAGELQENSLVKIVNFTTSRGSLKEAEFVELTVTLKNFGSVNEKISLNVDSRDLAAAPSSLDYEFKPFEEKTFEFRLIGGDAEEPKTVYYTVIANGTNSWDTKTGFLTLEPNPTMRFIVKYYLPLQIGLGGIAVVLIYINYKEYKKRKRQREAMEKLGIKPKKKVKGRREEK